MSENGEVVHITETAPALGGTEAEIDWKRRFDHMQQHSGEHVLCGAFNAVLGAVNVGFHLGAESSQIDLNLPALDAAQAQEAEDLANRIVFADLPVAVREVDPATLDGIRLRKPPEARYATVRLVEVPDFDCCPCGGTHVARTGEIGLIKIRGWEKRRGGVRVDFVCGRRALLDYRSKLDTVNHLSGRLAAPPADVAAAVERRLARLEALTRELGEARRELNRLLAEDLLRAAPVDSSGRRVICRELAADPAALNDLASRLTAMPGTVALLAGVDREAGKVHLLFSAAPGAEADMSRLLKAALPLVNGRGGGNARTAQGGGDKLDAVAAALDMARNLL